MDVIVGRRRRFVLGVAAALVAACSSATSTSGSPTSGAVTSSPVIPSTAPAAATSTVVPSTTPPAPTTEATAPPSTFPAAAARPIRFASGEDHADLSGSLEDGYRALYVFDATAGQHFDVGIDVGTANDQPGFHLTVYRPDGVLLGGGTAIAGVLPASGTYGLALVSDAEITPGTTRPYQLHLRIAAGGVTCEAPCTVPGWDHWIVSLTSGDTEIRASLPRFFDASSGAWLSDVSAALMAQVAPPGPPSQPETIDTSITSDVVLANRQLLAVELTSTSYVTGAAHPYTTLTSFVWGDAEQRPLGPAELLVDTSGDGGAAAWAQMRQPLLDALVAYEQSIGGLTPNELEGMEIDDLTDYALVPSPTGLRVGFSQCQIVACAAGIATVELPYARLAGIVRSDVIAAAAGPYTASG